MSPSPSTSTSTSSMAVLIVGAGIISQHHLKAMQACGRFHCTAVADPNRAAAEALASSAPGESSVRVFKTMQEALAADPNADLFSAVWVLVPNVGSLHTSLAAKALRAGRHVLLEKPIALKLADAERLVRLHQTLVREAEAEGRGRAAPHLMVAENAAFWSAVRAVGRVIESGAIGKVCLVRSKCWESASGPWADCYRAEGWICTGEEGGIFDSASHWLRPLRMWFGDVEAVLATTPAEQPLARMRGPSALQALLRFKTGLTAVFESVLAPEAIGDQPFFTVQGTKGEVVLEGFGGTVHLYTGQPTAEATYARKVVVVRADWDTSYVDELRVFAGAVLDGLPLPKHATAGEALGDLRTLRAMFTSAAGGGTRWCRCEQDGGGGMVSSLAAVAVGAALAAVAVSCVWRARRR